MAGMYPETPRSVGRSFAPESGVAGLQESLFTAMMPPSTDLSTPKSTALTLIGPSVPLNAYHEA